MNRWAFLSEVVESLAFPELGHTGRPTPFQVVSSPSKKNNFIGVNIGETVLPWCWRTLSKTASSGCFFFDCRCSDTTLCSFKTSCRIVIRFDTWRDDTQRLKDTWGWKVIQVSISTKPSNNGIMLKFWVIRYPSCVGWLGRGFPVNPPDICRFRVAKTRSSTMCSYRGWRVSAPVA